MEAMLKPGSLKGKTIIVTGGGDVSGLGCDVLYQASCQVPPAAMMSDLHPPAVSEFKRILGTFQGAARRHP